jgi:hypothetical protein
METAPIESLFSSLDRAVEILAEHRRPDAEYIAAFDTLKQARALIAQAFAAQPAAAAVDETELLAS